MDILNSVINTCQITRGDAGNIAYYSHLIPIFFSLLLGFLVYFKSSKKILSKIFLSFSLVFSLWLIADLITWVSNNYFLVYSFWSPVDLIETIMYLIGLYFAIVFSKKTDISWISKLLLLIIVLIPFVITITGSSVLGYYYPVCEAINNNFLLNYRFLVEILVVMIILIYTILPFFKKAISSEKKSRLIVLGSIFLFLTVFGVTSYLSAVTAYYELNLYALFIIPLFLIAITYSIFSLDIFNVKTLGTYFIVFGFIVLSATQLIFMADTTNKLLTILTIVLSIILSFILFKNLKKESDQRVRIEKLSVELGESNNNLEVANEKLKSLDRLKTEFVSLASHQLRSPLTAINGYLSLILQGDYGELNPQAKEAVGKVAESSNNLMLVVEDLLNVSKIEAGGMKYVMEKFDFAEVVTKTTEELSITAEKKGLKLICNIPHGQKYFINGDKEKLRQILVNILDNSMKYTEKGQIEVNMIHSEDGKIVTTIKDTGMGIKKGEEKSLFNKFSRGEGAKINSSGSGLGLYLVREIVKAHNGRVWAESEGLGKGSTFFIELKEVK